MPITIRELVIRTIITDADERGGESSGGASAQQSGEMEDMIQECVTQVMERLREQHER